MQPFALEHILRLPRGIELFVFNNVAGAIASRKMLTRLHLPGRGERANENPLGIGSLRLRWSLHRRRRTLRSHMPQFLPKTSDIDTAGITAAVADYIAAGIKVTAVGTVYFQYGASRRYRHRSRTQKLRASQIPVQVSALLTRLTPGRRYHYRVVVANAGADGEA